MDQVPRGIQNLGQTCYAAAALQCLRALSVDGPWNHPGTNVSGLVATTTEPGDAHEFLMSLLERWNLDRLVSGTYVVRTLCTQCKTAKLTKDPFVFIRAVREPPETIEGYACRTCKTHVTQARRACRFWKLPPVVVGLGPSFADVQTFETKDVHGNYVYDRKGFVVYVPGKMHYIAIVCHRGSWFLCDDASVRKISGEPPRTLPVTMTLYETGHLKHMGCQGKTYPKK